MATALPLSSCTRRVTGAILALVSLTGALAGCAPAETTQTVPVTTASTAATASPAGTRLLLRYDGQVATATLAATAVARRFAAMLPPTLHLSGPMGQAKSAPLPRSRSLDVTGADRTFRTVAGELSYWSPSAKIAVVYNDLGQRVPEPGLVRLGVVDGGLADLAAAGNDLTVLIDVAAPARP